MDKIRIQGESVHNLNISELLTALKSTKLVEFSEEDIRTQIYFENIDLDMTKIETSKNFKDMGRIPSFTLSLDAKAKESGQAEQPTGEKPISSVTSHEKRPF